MSDSALAPSAGTTTVRVLYADTDMAGVVYHANYLRFFEAARTDLFYGLGIDVARVQDEDRILFAITAADLQFLRPARYGDLLTVQVFPVKLRPASCILRYEVTRGDELCVTGTTTVAALDAGSQRVVRWPAQLAAGLAALADSLAEADV